MSLTTEQKKHCGAVRTAAANGEACELRKSNGVDWIKADPFDSPIIPEQAPDRWRIAPKPVTRPWSKRDDIPMPICWLQSFNDDGSIRDVLAMITSVSDRGITVVGPANDVKFYSWELIAEKNHKLRHTTDGVNFHPCTVEEKQ